MRLRTDIFVSALMRRVFSRGDFAAVEAKGAEEAGAVFVRQVFRDGLESLYAPAPQSVFDDEDSGRRLFEARLERVAELACRTETINPRVEPAPQSLQDKHYLRKHGPNAYYGQGGK